MNDLPYKPQRFWDLLKEPPAKSLAPPSALDSNKPQSLWDLLKNPSEDSSPASPAPRSESNALVRRKIPSLPCALEFDPDMVYWAMRNTPIQQALRHHAICGTTGSGKTTMIQLLLQSIAPRFQKTSSAVEQLIVYDPKCDMVPLMAALDLKPEEHHVWILNPYDERSTPWNIAEAVQTPGMALALAALLVPEEKNSTAPYFSFGARNLTHAGIMGLNTVAGTNWTFRDLFWVLSTRERIAAIVAQSPSGAEVGASILKDKRHSPSVIATLANKLASFEQVAALWHTNKSGRAFSIEKFLREPGVLILGDDPVLHNSVWPLNAMLLKALTNEILRRPNTRQPRHWFILDEFRAMERVDCIHDLVNRGRSKGACVLLGIQSIEGLFEVYGEHATNDILSQCTSKIFLRAGGPKTAEWIADYFSKVRQVETVVTETSTSQGDSTSTQYALNDRPMFLPSYFLNLPLPEEHKPLVAVCDVPSSGFTIIVRRPFDEVLSWCRDVNRFEADYPGLKPYRDIKSQVLQPWTEEEEIRFCGTRVTDDLANEKIRPPEGPPPRPMLPPRHDIDG